MQACPLFRHTELRAQVTVDKTHRAESTLESSAVANARVQFGGNFHKRWVKAEAQAG